MNKGSKFIPQKGEEILKLVQDCSFFKEGWRGKIYIGKFEGKKVAVKIARTPELAENIKKEGQIIEIVNSKGIGPNLLIYGYDFVITEFIEGVHLKTLLSKKDKKIFDIFEKILIQSRELDKLKISKDEMHRPYTNIIVSGDKVFLIDFESSQITDKPKNTTQFFSFLLSYFKTNFFLTPREIEEGIELMQRYKISYLEEDFHALLRFLREKLFPKSE